jgi:multidrug transporter EmrE-like cation transporter
MLTMTCCLNDRYLDAVLFAAYTIGSVAGLILVKSNMATAKTLLMTRELLTAPVFLSLAGAALYIGSFAIWLVILGRNELSVAYPIAIGLTLAFSTCTAGVMLGEVLTAWRIGGIALVFLGILTIARS